MTTDVIIIGGGISGLACAVGLSGSGLGVTLVESSPFLGGRARSWVDEVTGDEIDLGPHVLTNEHRNMLQLLKILGTDRDVVWHTDNFLVLADQPPLVMKRYPLVAPFSLLPNLFTVRKLALRDLASNTPVVLRAMKLSEEDVARLDAEAAEHFLTRMGVTHAFIDWFWKSASMTFMNVPLEACSAGALLRVVRQLLGDNRFRFGFPAQGLGSLFAPSAAKRIMAEGGRIITGHAVQSLVHERERIAGVVLDDGTRLETRYCVSAIPPQHLLSIVPENWTHAALRNLADFAPVPYISSYVWFDRRLTGEQMWTRLWSTHNLSYDSYDLSNIRSGWRHRPSVIASNIIHSQRAQAMSDNAIVQTTVSEIAQFIPQAAAATIVHARVNRIPMGISAPHPGIEGKRPDTRTSIRGLFLAGDWTNTHFPFSMESAVLSGWRAAEQIWAEIGRPRRLTLPMETTTGIAGLFGRWGSARHHAEPAHP